jgi:NTP pyrophosphatase (non-canonical NTP hydrolase)
MEKLFKEVVEWQDKTFPKSHALAKWNHLFEEVRELGEIVEYEHYSNQILEFNTEIADCMILLFGIAHKRGMSYEDLHRLIEYKMEINKDRNWGIEDANGIVNHLK